MTPIRKRLMRVIALAVMVMALTANVAAASDEGASSDCVPYDPGLPSISEQLSSHTGCVPATSTDRRQRLEIDGKPFLFQHGYRFGKVTYVTRLPLDKSMTVFAPGHLSASEVESVVRGDNPWMLD